MTGNRVLHGMNEIGGVRRDLTPDLMSSASARLPNLEERITKYLDLVGKQETMLMRFKGIGKLSPAKP